MALATKTNNIHPTAVINPRARIGNGCYIGPYSIIGEDVELKDDVRLESHCVIDGRTIIGEGTRVFPFVSIGLPPQDLKYKGEPSETRIGRRNLIREFVTIHRGTAGGGMLTQTGDDCLLMAQAHVAHDCILGDGVIMANAATLAGHVIIENNANVGAYSGVHQFCRVGQEAYIGGYSVVVKDALPFALTVGNHAQLLWVEYDRNETARLFAGGDQLFTPRLSSASFLKTEHFSGSGANQRGDQRRG